ncbi:MAG: 16S rRNA (cytosine(1402)-N(4))-methyltransferase RsmH [Patescibacteria group bacterium]
MAHIPVLIKEVLDGLDPMPNQNFIDATVGDGGHASAILEKTAPNGKLIAVDRDQTSIISAKINLEHFGDRVLFINDSFSNLKKITLENKIGLINGILFDFGMSSSQLENSERGFSFAKDEILDMRFDLKNPVTAEHIVNTYSEAELTEIFKKWGEEPRALKIAAAIIEARKKNRIKTTRELVQIIEKVKQRYNRLHPATLIFQALRIEVNNEIGEIEQMLDAIPEILNRNGKAAFISFHSLEDRLIKNWSRNFSKQGKIKIINGKPITVSLEELKINPRSRSAKLRVIEKI